MNSPYRRLSYPMRVIRRVNVRAEEYYQAERALLEAGEAVVPILEKLLQDRDWVLRNRASDILRKLNSKRDGSDWPTRGK
jgi:HEAT repeat protein